MERIKRNMDRIHHSNQNLSTIVCFNLAMKEGKYSSIDISLAFREYVNTSDYRRADYDTLVDYAIQLNEN